MKNIHDILAEYGLTVPGDKKTAFDEVMKANYKTVAEVEKITSARDNYKSQLETAQNALKEFEGVDVKDLQGKIQKLQQDLADSDKAHKEQLAQRDFDDLLSSFAGEYKARDIKAVVPFLDTETLRSSKNQKDDLKAAFEQVKKDKAYLFEDETVPQVVSFTSGTSEKTDSAKTQANNALRSFFGKD